MTNRQIVVWNLVAFAIVHFILEFVIRGANNRIGAFVIVNYIISYWIVQPQIDKRHGVDLATYTWLVSGCVLIVRCMLGLVAGLMMAA